MTCTLPIMTCTLPINVAAVFLRYLLVSEAKIFDLDPQVTD